MLAFAVYRFTVTEQYRHRYTHHTTPHNTLVLGWRHPTILASLETGACQHPTKAAIQSHNNSVLDLRNYHRTVRKRQDPPTCLQAPDSGHNSLLERTSTQRAAPGSLHTKLPLFVYCRLLKSTCWKWWSGPALLFPTTMWKASRSWKTR